MIYIHCSEIVCFTKFILNILFFIIISFFCRYLFDANQQILKKTCIYSYMYRVYQIHMYLELNDKEQQGYGKGLAWCSVA